MRRPLRALLLTLLLQACYERGPFSGPLAGLADSVVGKHSIDCLGSNESRLPRQPPHRGCLVVGDSSSYYFVGRSGRILSVVRNWPAESTDATNRTLSAFRERFGAPSYEGDDGHGNPVHHWRMDSLCVGVFELRLERKVQLDVSLPEFLGGTCT